MPGIRLILAVAALWGLTVAALAYSSAPATPSRTVCYEVQRIDGEPGFHASLCEE